MIYLDYNATAPTRPEALAALVAAVQAGGNPSSVHSLGRAARRRVEEARRAVADLVAVDANQVIFTATGTEANNMALGGYPDHAVIISAIEHDAVKQAAPEATILPVKADGTLDLDALDAALAQASRPPLVSVMLANSETGILQPIPEIAARVHATGGLLHCDAVQAAGRIPLDMATLGADLLTLSGHKLGGVPGAAALILGASISGTTREPLPLLRGGGQEKGRRAGTEAVGAIAAFGVAAQAAKAEIPAMAALADLRDKAEADLRALGAFLPAVTGAPRLPNCFSVALPGKPAETQVIALDLAGFAVSAGSACSSGKVKRSAVLAAMGYGDNIASATIRVSFGVGTTAAQLEHFCSAWQRLAGRSVTPHTNLVKLD
jgi:cysteine desulfurase